MPTKITQLHEFGPLGIEHGKFFQGVVYGENLVVLLEGGRGYLRHFHSLLTAAVTCGAFAASCPPECGAWLLQPRRRNGFVRSTSGFHHV
jgi:hypothetical protein